MSNTLFVWLVILGMTLITYALRLSFILLFGRMTVPPVLERALRYVPAAVLAALVAPALAYRGSALALSPNNERLLAGLLAALVAWRTGNILLTIASGMLALWALQATM